MPSHHEWLVIVLSAVFTPEPQEGLDIDRSVRRVRSAYRPPPTRHLRVTRFGGHERLAPPIRAAPAVSCDYRPTVANEPSNRDIQSLRADSIVRWIIIGVEYAILASLLLVAGVVLVHSVDTFLRYGRNFSDAVVQAIDGILVVIITLDIAHTVFGHLRTSVFPLKPFIVIGILAGVRDILSASARLTLTSSLTQREFYDTLISLGVGVGVVVFLLLGLLILRFSGHIDD